MLDRMNYYDCWTTTHCGDGTWGTDLFWAKWGGQICTHALGQFVGAISVSSLQCHCLLLLHVALSSMGMLCCATWFAS